MTMHKIALVLLCLACAGHGRRLQNSLTTRTLRSSPCVESITARKAVDLVDLFSNKRLLAELRQISANLASNPLNSFVRLLLALNPTAAFYSVACSSSAESELSHRLLSKSPALAQRRALNPVICSLSLSSDKQESTALSTAEVLEESLVVSSPVELSFWSALKGALTSTSFSEFMGHLRKECGDTVFVNLWPVLPPMYVLMGKAANRDVFSALDPSLAQILQEFINLLPISARVPAEEDVTLQMKMAQLFSSSSHINKRLPSFNDITAKTRSDWIERTDAGGLGVFFELSEYVLRADLEVLYGKRFTERYAPQLVTRFGDWVSNIANGQLVGFFQELGEFLSDTIEEMESNPEAYRGERSVLQVYLKADARENHDVDAIVGLLSMSLMAAVFNTQVTLAWILVHLYAEPDLLARARKEIADCPDLDDWTALSELEFLNSCIDEAVRLHTTLPGNTVLRKTRHDLKLGETTVKEGSIIWLYPNAVHQDERYFPEAAKFCPMRLLSGNLEKMNTEFELVTFGHGQKRCVGEKMARAMILTFLTNFLPNVDADATDDLPENDFFDLIPASKLRLYNLRKHDN